MSGNVWDTPEGQAWRTKTTRDLVPMIERSAISLMLFNAEPDAKLAVELGFMILLDKPILILKRSGDNVPATLARIADSIIEYDDNLESPAIRERITDEVSRILAERGHRKEEITE